jgi:hypothetical protein
MTAALRALLRAREVSVPGERRAVARRRDQLRRALRAESIFFGRKLRQQVRPIASNDAADFAINGGDNLKFLDLPTNPFKIVRAKGSPI